MQLIVSNIIIMRVIILIRDGVMFMCNTIYIVQVYSSIVV